MSVAVKKHSERKHSKFAASKAYLWTECAASVPLSEKAPYDPPGPAAAEGTKAHECLEYIIKRYSNRAKLKPVLLKTYPIEMVDYALASAEIVMGLRPSKDAKLMIEQRVYIANTAKEAFGTVDYAWVDLWGKLIVIDFKYGKWLVLPVDSDTGKENAQLMYYANGIAAKYDFEFSSVELAIVQPRAWSGGENPLTIAKTTVKRVREFEHVVKNAMKAAKAPNPTPTPGDHCTFCPAASFCPAVSKLQMEKAGMAFDDVSGEISTPEVKTLDDAKLGMFLGVADILDTWISHLRAHAFLRARSGIKIEGRKLVERESKRQWSPGAESKAQKLFGALAFCEPNLVTPAQLEKACGKKAKDFTASHSFKKVTGYTLAPAADRREEVSNVSNFEAIEEEESF